MEKLQGYVSKETKADPAYWVWHSEKSKNTCENCKKHDGKKFFTKEAIPQLPVHPNCKCRVEPVYVAKGCNCKQDAKNLRERCTSILYETRKLLDDVSKFNVDAALAKKAIDETLTKLQNEYQLWKDEIGKHQPECKKNANMMCAKIYSNNEDLKKLKANKWDKNLQGVIVLKYRLQVFEKDFKSLLLDINILVENIENTMHHSKNECKFKVNIDNFEVRVNTKQSELHNFQMEFLDYRTKINSIPSELVKYENLNKQAQELRNIKCDCAYSTRKKTLMEHATDFVSEAGNPIPLSGTNLNDAMNNFRASRDNECAKIFDSRFAFDDDNINKILDKIGVPKTSRGVLYNSNSNQSEKLFDTHKIKQFIKENYKKLKEGDYKNTVHLIEFEKNDPDAHAALQHCIIYDAYIDENGYFNATIIDYYDFNRRDGGDFMKYLNNWGHAMQEKGYLENYFVIYQIKKML